MMMRNRMLVMRLEGGEVLVVLPSGCLSSVRSGFGEKLRLFSFCFVFSFLSNKRTSFYFYLYSSLFLWLMSML